MNENSSLLPSNQIAQTQLSQQTSSTSLQTARRYLYFSHLFAKGSQNTWSFCLTLFLAAFSNYKSLILVSTYGLVSGLAICFAGGQVGKIVDDYPRLFTAKYFIQLQNGFVILATCLSYELLSVSTEQWIGMDTDEKDQELLGWFEAHFYGVPISTYSIVLLIGLHIFGPLADMLDQGLTVAMERDWIVVMSEVAGDLQEPEANGEDIEQIQRNKDAIKNWLSETNVFMCQIDLSCQILAPTVAGFLVALFGSHSNLKDDSEASDKDLRGAAILVGALNILSLIVEYICVTKIYNLIPSLAYKKRMSKTTTTTTTIAAAATTTTSESQRITKEIECSTLEGCCLCNMLPNFTIYMKQPVSWAGFALSLLYLNMLSFGGIMTAYLVWRGMRVEVIGIWRGVSGVIGLSGTSAFAFSVSRISLEVTGLWSIILQFICLTLSYASLFVDDYNQSLTMLIVGVCASRIGLWVFDITVTQLMQLRVPEKMRGVVGGMQASLNAFFGLLAYGIGILYPDPSQFFILVGVGYAAVGMAAIMYGCWCSFQKGFEKVII